MTTPTQTPKSIHELYTFYLSAAHVKDPRTVTISKAEIRNVYNAKAMKELPEVVIHFSDARRSLKCNKTQVEALWTITGSDDLTKWAGVKITLEKVATKASKFTIKITKAE